MTKERQALINRFQKWLDTNPKKEIIASQCATIAEEYHNEQLLINSVVVPKGALSCDCPKCGKEMKSQLVNHHNCIECKEHYTST